MKEHSEDDSHTDYAGGYNQTDFKTNWFINIFKLSSDQIIKNTYNMASKKACHMKCV